MNVAIYCRLSEEDRQKQSDSDDSGSIKNQKKMLCDYAQEKQWDIYDIYSDDDYAGADRKRPAFCRLLQDAQEKKFDVVLCKTQSRFTRELELVEKYIHGMFPALGIRFVSVVDHGDTDNKGNKKARQINGLMNEWYLEDMSENIRSVLTCRRKQGLHIGSFALYGYVKNPDRKGHLLLDPEAAAVVREVFSLYNQGMGKTAIARLLNERGIPNPSEYKRLHGLRYAQAKGKTGTLWKYPSISAMLSNEIYRGHMIQGRYGSVSYKTKENKPRPPENWMRVEDTHEAIIDETLWESVVKRRESKAKPFTNGTVGLFAGKVKCLHCGYALRSHKSRGKHYLQCSNRHVSKEACIGAFIAVDFLEERVLEEWKKYANLCLDVEMLSRSLPLQKNIQGEQERLLALEKQGEKKLLDSGTCLQNLYRDKVRGIVSEEEFCFLQQEFQAEKKGMELSLAEVKHQRQALSETVDLGGNRAIKSINDVKVESLTPLMIHIFVEYIAVGRRLEGTREIPLEIHWEF